MTCHSPPQPLLLRTNLLSSFRGANALQILSFILLAFSTVVKAQPAQREPQYDPHHFKPSENPCYDTVGSTIGKISEVPARSKSSTYLTFQRGQAQRCVPDFINAAFNLEVEVTNTCGERHPTRFCVQTGHMGIRKVCDVCDARVSAYSHPASYLTDFNNPDNETWWQSETMLERIQYPRMVNLTLRLGKAFDITYVRLKFVSPRPESFVIYKKTRPDDDWIPWQYYSGSCRSTFKLPEKAPILPGNEAVAQCTREFSDISPLTGGNIAFPTLEGRPSAENFEESEVLQEWVTAYAIRISFRRLNTYGDEIFGDRRVLMSYYYAVSDFAVGGRCKCNGHASQCVKSTGQGGQQLVCDCKHHTAGVDCQQCEPFYVDRPWRPGTSTEANECLPCDCNGLSQRCFFDQKLYEATGHGGHCIDCAGNTQGAHCEECLPNHWRRPGEAYCTPCGCSDIGSTDGQCDANGQCTCKLGVTGQYCNRCEHGFYDFGANGCKDCHCEIAGSYNNTPLCSPVNGACSCKANVEGQQCDKCKPGYFQLALSNQYGCNPCFCYGHSSICSAADGYYTVNVTSDFLTDAEEWTAGSDARPEDVQWAQIDRAAAISQMDDHPVYFYAPLKFLGDQRLSYNQQLSFNLRVQQSNPGPSTRDLVIVGANGREVAIPIFAQSNAVPSTREQSYKFRVSADRQMQWTPTLREVDYIAILSNISAIKIRGTYSKGDVGFISNFRMGSASLTPEENGEEARPAEWVEACKCTEGFIGQFCESCAYGYKRANKFGGPLAKCIKCDCHGHSDSCEPESGVCICEHNTAGDTCERCARGYYGDALNGTEEDCKKCDCPEDGPCILHGDGDTICTECPDGYTGRKCDSCADEFFGNPLEGIECKRCECSGNTDPNSIGNCDTVTGECKKCIHHTTGFNCEHCARGYWGDALAETKGDCKACQCYAPGTLRPSADYDVLECRQSDGQCNCHPNVLGLRCDQCEDGYFNLTSGSGCQPCDCDILGSVNGSCDVLAGQCHCKPGVTGRRCDQCAPMHYGFGSEGCKLCDCDMLGSERPECDVTTGQCLCKDNVEGRRCDRCSENRYDMRSGCLACDDCYSLIQSRKNSLNASVSTLRENLDEIQNNPVKVDDREFDDKVGQVKGEVDELHDRATKQLSGDDSQMRLQVGDLKEQLSAASTIAKSVGARFDQLDSKSSRVEHELKRFDSEKERVLAELNNAITYVEAEGGTQLSRAQNALQRHGDKSQELSNLAEEAKQMADKQEERKKEVKMLADKASNTSRTARQETNEAIFGTTSTSQQIANLLNQVQETKELLAHTKDLSVEQGEQSTAVYDEAARSLSNAEGIKLPHVDVDQLEERATALKTEAKQILANVQQKAEEGQETQQKAEKLIREMADQLRTLEEKQRYQDRQLEEVEQYYNRAKDAFDQSTKTWNDAQDSHNSLTDFHLNVQRHKEDALNELEGLPSVEDELRQAEEATREAEGMVGDARNNAHTSLSGAEEAKTKGEKLAQEAVNLASTVASAKSNLTEKRDMVEQIVGAIDGLGTTVKDFENQALSDSEKSSEVLKRASLAESNTKLLQERMHGVENKLYDALDQLNALETVDDEQLSGLEQLLTESEQQYDQSEWEQQLTDQIKGAEHDTAKEKGHIEQLNKDLENLRSIRDSLPTKCFNLVSLEQEGQR